MERKQLNFGQTLQESFTLGIKNAPSVFAAVVLWIITIWIPYINVGTTIAIAMLPVELAKGNIINPLGIFDSKWRRYMGEFFITEILTFFGIMVAVSFLLIPGIVLSIAWSLALYFLIEKGMNPIQSIKASNDATYGSKWPIFFATLLIGVILGVIAAIFFGICSLIDSDAITIIVMSIVAVAIATISIACSASIWRQLQDNVK